MKDSGNPLPREEFSLVSYAVDTITWCSMCIVAIFAAYKLGGNLFSFAKSPYTLKMVVIFAGFIAITSSIIFLYELFNVCKNILFVVLPGEKNLHYAIFSALGFILLVVVIILSLSAQALIALNLISI